MVCALAYPPLTPFFSRQFPTISYLSIPLMTKQHVFDLNNAPIVYAGRFIYLDLSRLIVGQEASLTSEILSSTSGSQCFSFWYNVHYVFNTGKFFARVMVGYHIPSNMIILHTHNTYYVHVVLLKQGTACLSHYRLDL